MPRPLRILFEGAWYHVMNRGLNHQVIFDNDKHRMIFLGLLKKISSEFLVEIHSFCLMDNHYHILMRTPLPNLNDAMRYLDGVYTQRYNNSVIRDGSLFRGRYKSILIKGDSYLLQVSRYIHQNPVAAKICNHPSLYKWSSYHAYADYSDELNWVYTNFLLDMFDKPARQKKFIEFTTGIIDDETVRFYQHPQLKSIFGNTKCINEELNKINNEYKTATLSDFNRTMPLPDYQRTIEIIASYYNVAPDYFQQMQRGRNNRPRMIAIFLARKLCRLKHREIAANFYGIKAQSVSAHIARCEKLLLCDPEFENDFQKLTSLIES